VIGLALHLGQRALDGLVDRLLPLPVSLALGLCRETSEVERLGAECDQLRDERDFARAQLADAQSLAHEARLEYGAARETCEQLRGELAKARRERDELRRLALHLKTTWTAHMVPETSVTGWAWAEVKKSIADLIVTLPPEATQ